MFRMKQWAAIALIFLAFDVRLHLLLLQHVFFRSYRVYYMSENCETSFLDLVYDFIFIRKIALDIFNLLIISPWIFFSSRIFMYNQISECYSSDK